MTIPPQAHDYLTSLRVDPGAKRQCCQMPLGGIYWSDEIPSFDRLLSLPVDDRNSIYRLFSIRFKLWANSPLSSEEDILWCYCEKEYPECPIFRRKILNPEDQAAQGKCQADALECFEALFAGADKIEMREGPYGLKAFSATFDLTKEDRVVPFWKRLFRRWRR